MNFMQLIQSLDDLLYEIMSWLVFFPLTLWRTVTRPLRMMEYASSQLGEPVDEQFGEALSPPLFLLVGLLISHALELATGGGTNPIVANSRGLAAFVDSDTKLLLLRLIIFSVIPLALATTFVVASRTRLSDENLKAPFYAQCYPAAPFALTVGIGGVLLGHSIELDLLGLAIILLALILYFALQVRWFWHSLGRRTPAAMFYAAGGIGAGVSFAVLVSVLFM